MTSFSRPGAIDLSSLAAPAGAPAGAPGPTGGTGTYALDVTEASFQADVIDASSRHVVVLSLWSGRAPQTADFNDVLARVVDSYEGRLTLARVDGDANPQIAQALQARSVPYVVGIVGGQPVPLFQGTVDEPEVRRFLDELVKVAVQHGVTGTATPSGAAAAPVDGAQEEAAPDPRFAAADGALAEGDLDAAVAAYQQLVTANPGDSEAAERLAGVSLMRRTAGADLVTARAAAADDPADVDAQLLVADLDVSGGHVDDAFARLIDLVRRTAGDERERVRTRLIELFTVVGTDDPRVPAARRALASALF